MPPKSQNNNRKSPPQPDEQRSGRVRREADIALAGLPQRFGALEARVGGLETGLARNNEMTQTIAAFVDDVGAVWRVCKMIRSGSIILAKWFTAIAVGITSVIAAAHAVGAIDVGAWFRTMAR